MENRWHTSFRRYPNKNRINRQEVRWPMIDAAEEKAVLQIAASKISEQLAIELVYLLCSVIKGGIEVGDQGRRNLLLLTVTSSGSRIRVRV